MYIAGRWEWVDWCGKGWEGGIANLYWGMDGQMMGREGQKNHVFWKYHENYWIFFPGRCASPLEEVLGYSQQKKISYFLRKKHVF